MDELDIFIGGQWCCGGGNLMYSQFLVDGVINVVLYVVSFDDLQEVIDCVDCVWWELMWWVMLLYQWVKILYKVVDLIEVQFDEFI